MVKFVLFVALLCLAWTIAPAAIGRLARWGTDKLSGAQRLRSARTKQDRPP